MDLESLKAYHILCAITYLMLIYDSLISGVLDGSKRVERLNLLLIVITHSMHEAILLLFVMRAHLYWSGRSCELVAVALK